jgi:aspartate-semialdehyde dehydrogenase
MSPKGAYRVGVAGATGAVGSTILEVLAERKFPVGELVLLASARSAGSKVKFAGSHVEVRELGEDSFQGLDLILSSAGGKVSSEWAPKWIEAGAVVVDNTSFWRMHDDVPLVVAGVNDDAAAGHTGLVANPNCTTMQMMVALKPILDAAGIERLIVLPQVETFKDGDDYTTEERKVMAETRKILGLSEDVGISATCARVPVVTGHSESVNVQTAKDLSPEECRELLSEFPGLVVLDDPSDGIYPLPIAAAGRDEVLVGRIRRDPSHERCLNLWVVGDNLRKGAATNAVQVAELLHERDLVRVPAGASLS